VTTLEFHDSDAIKRTEYVGGDSHSILILAHEDVDMIRRIVKRMSSVGPTFVHVDAKSIISKSQYQDMSCIFVEPTVPVYWGDWSVVEATVLLLEAALVDPSTTRFTLLSGSHYPIISNREIALKAGVSGNVIASRNAPNMPDGSRPEVEYERRSYKSNKPNGWWVKTKNGFMNRVVYCGRPLDWKAVTPPTGMRAGSQYWSIERKFAEYCVAQIRSSRPLIEYFKQIGCSDEKVFATLYGEYSDQTALEGTTYVKWAGRANPSSISRSDIEKAIEMGQYWFARKFRASD
jgi:hypothetical protein